VTVTPQRRDGYMVGGDRNRSGPLVLASALLVAALLLAACSSGGSSSGGSGSGSGIKIAVVAAENFWGSIATQLGGDRVSVTSIITSPDTDPHSYEPTAGDARTVASAQYVIVNGIGYDPWSTWLLSANPVSGRSVLNVGNLVGVQEGGNPHRWYFPNDVEAVINQIVSDYKRLDPADASYFDRQREAFETTALAKYHGLISAIKGKYAGTPVGASESIFVGLAQATGLDLITPADYMKAISEGTDPTAQDKATMDQQIHQGQLKVFVFNSQNATPDIQTLVDAARAKGIPVTTVTETLSPAGASFEDWQSQQLQHLEDALAQATGR
jgi:zinc/manganese transport system substrate-binding protein